jgi:hypothetical protein
MTGHLTRRVVVAGVGALAVSALVPGSASCSLSVQMQAAVSEFREAADHFLRVRFETFYAGATVRRSFETFECPALQPWDQAIGRLRCASEAVLSQHPAGSGDVLCKLDVLEALYGGRPLPDTEWSFTCAAKWTHRVETEARPFGLRVDPAWARKAIAFFEQPEDAFHAALGRMVGRLS